MAPTMKYEPLDTSDDGKDLPFGDEASGSAILAVASRKERRAKILCWSGLAMWVLGMVFFVAAVMRKPTMMECHKMVSPWSNVWDGVEFYERDFINFFNHSTIYRGPPTLEREEAWDRLWRQHSVGVKEDGRIALNKTAGQTVQVEGSDPNDPTYAGVLEVFHQLHCLNLLRQYSWPLEMFKEEWGDVYPYDLEEPLAARMHVDHCIETIRLSLMCYVDVTPVFLEVNEERMYGQQANFNVYHKCRDFDKIVEYVSEHGQEIEDPEKWRSTHIRTNGLATPTAKPAKAKSTGTGVKSVKSEVTKGAEVKSKGETKPTKSV